MSFRKLTFAVPGWYCLPIWVAFFVVFVSTPIVQSFGQEKFQNYVDVSNLDMLNQFSALIAELELVEKQQEAIGELISEVQEFKKNSEPNFFEIAKKNRRPDSTELGEYSELLNAKLRDEKENWGEEVQNRERDVVQKIKDDVLLPHQKNRIEQLFRWKRLQIANSSGSFLGLKNPALYKYLGLDTETAIASFESQLQDVVFKHRKRMDNQLRELEDVKSPLSRMQKERFQAMLEGRFDIQMLERPFVSIAAISCFQNSIVRERLLPTQAAKEKMSLVQQEHRELLAKKFDVHVSKVDPKSLVKFEREFVTQKSPELREILGSESAKKLKEMILKAEAKSFLQMLTPSSGSQFHPVFVSAIPPQIALEINLATEQQDEIIKLLSDRKARVLDYRAECIANTEADFREGLELDIRKRWDEFLGPIPKSFLAK